MIKTSFLNLMIEIDKAIMTSLLNLKNKNILKNVILEKVLIKKLRISKKMLKYQILMRFNGNSSLK